MGILFLYVYFVYHICHIVKQYANEWSPWYALLMSVPGFFILYPQIGSIMWHFSTFENIWVPNIIPQMFCVVLFLTTWFFLTIHGAWVLSYPATLWSWTYVYNWLQTQIWIKFNKRSKGFIDTVILKWWIKNQYYHNGINLRQMHILIQVSSLISLYWLFTHFNFMVTWVKLPIRVSMIFWNPTLNERVYQAIIICCILYIQCWRAVITPQVFMFHQLQYSAHKLSKCGYRWYETWDISEMMQVRQNIPWKLFKYINLQQIIEIPANMRTWHVVRADWYTYDKWQHDYWGSKTALYNLVRYSYTVLLIARHPDVFRTAPWGITIYDCVN